ncbi:hypothetical protein [Oceanobacillus sp. J11TS1]|uniref:hypothetical protein n=1 Tax=Oceanobacillus sp. J11TS1 TaxID=2807191 RepID=UPI001B215DB3|nr:hypothetical protein [Oceanobacillus sp. J11TS1]GIO23769.1 hypothetical protein J11TS1_23500 [Oceanobacillus sp. J11TS1]
MNKYQERVIYISAGALVFFLVLSLITNNLGFFLMSLFPVFFNVMIAFFAKNNKHMQKFNQRHSEKLKPK